MTGISSNTYIDSLRGQPEQPKTSDDNQTLKQEDFFSLLTQQLAYQDPTKPVDNDQMISQMTNFTMADGIQSLNSEFKNLSASMTSGQALQASSLIGRDVLIPTGDVNKVGEEPLKGMIASPKAAQDVTLRVEDENGQLIKTVSLGNHSGGTIDFSWDGTTQDGGKAPDGNYVIKAEGRIAGKNTALTVATYTKVNSVNIGAGGGGLTVNTNNGTIAFTDVLEVAG